MSIQQAKDRFIILRKMKYSEADLILHALSANGSKVSFIARGALRSKKRFGGGVLEPSHYVQLTYKPGQQEGQLNVLEEATLINAFAGIRTSYDKLEFALHTLECVSKVSLEGDQNSEFLFNLLGHTLRAIETCEELIVLKMQFYLKFLFQQGVMEIEPWMGPFLKCSLSESAKLLAYKDEAQSHIFKIELDISHYITNATI